VDNCAGKLIRSNHRLMGTYVQLMPKMVQRRMDEMQSKTAALEAEAAAATTAAAAAAAAAGSVAEPPPPTEFSVDQTSPVPPPSYPSPADMDAGPLQRLPAGPGQSVGEGVGVPMLDSGLSSLVQPTQSKMEAPIALTPPAPPAAAAETVIPTHVDHMAIGPASTVVSPLLGPSVSSVPDTPVPLAHIGTPPVVPGGPSVPTTPAPQESLAVDVSTPSKA